VVQKEIEEIVGAVFHPATKAGLGQKRPPVNFRTLLEDLDTVSKVEVEDDPNILEELVYPEDMIIWVYLKPEADSRPDSAKKTCVAENLYESHPFVGFYLTQSPRSGWGVIDIRYGYPPAGELKSGYGDRLDHRAKSTYPSTFGFTPDGDPREW